MVETQLQIRGVAGTLAASFTRPDHPGPYPAVLMLHGSGPLDRNENTLDQQLNVFNVIAAALASQGIASLRYDKRGCGQSGGDYLQAGHQDLLNDARTCFDALAALPHLAPRQLFILGHSEGCLLAPQLAQQDIDVAGLLLLCPLIEPVEAALLRQAEQVAKEMRLSPGWQGIWRRSLLRLGLDHPVKKQKRLIAQVQAGTVTQGSSESFGINWLSEMLALDPEAIFAATQTPMLLIAGEKDLQCLPEDIHRIAQVTPALTDLCLIEGMTHLLRIDPEVPSLMAYPQLLKQKVAPLLIERLVQWITNFPRRSSY